MIASRLLPIPRPSSLPDGCSSLDRSCVRSSDTIAGYIVLYNPQITPPKQRANVFGACMPRGAKHPEATRKFRSSRADAIARFRRSYQARQRREPAKHGHLVMTQGDTHPSSRQSCSPGESGCGTVHAFVILLAMPVTYFPPAGNARPVSTPRATIATPSVPPRQQPRSRHASATST